MQEEVINQSPPKNKIMIISIIILVIAIIAIVITGLYFLFNEEEENEEIILSPDYNTKENLEDNTTVINQNETVNDTLNEINETINETVDLGDFVPNPFGDVSLIDYRNSGEYSCNESGSDNPKHGLRVFSYRLINGTKTLSEDYLEFDKTDAICKGYANLEDGEVITYYLEWTWEDVTDVDGYRSYHYYTQENITRNYTHYVDSKFPKITDTKLDLWVRGNFPDNNPVTNTTN